MLFIFKYSGYIQTKFNLSKLQKYKYFSIQQNKMEKQGDDPMICIYQCRERQGRELDLL